MRVLVVGGGGREHAIVWKLSMSPRIEKIYCAPGNGGISRLAECVAIKASDIEGITAFSVNNRIDLVVVAPDDPLVAGMVDALEAAGIKAFGPVKAAAAIEGSKAFSKELMKKYEIPTAGYEIFHDSASAIAYLEKSKFPIVVKADGLALGKGVIIASDFEEARSAVVQIMEEKAFGTAGNQIVIEEFLIGKEVSILAFTDGKTVVPMVSSQDHKRALDNDMGLNTGGMGTFSPSRFYTEDIAAYCTQNIFEPTIAAMNAENRKFKGILYFGIILTPDGPKVLEYNARFGDPEAQVVLPRLKTDLLEIFEAVLEERLQDMKIEWYDNAAVCVILASGGYPKEYTAGYEITGVDETDAKDGIVLFHAGTRYDGGKFYTSGGRVLGVTAVGPDLDGAIARAYKAVGGITFKDMHFRKDIGIKHD